MRIRTSVNGHVLRREFAGERDSKPLVSWLNERPRTRYHGRMELLLADLSVVRLHHRGIYGWDPSSYWSPDVIGAVEELPSEVRRSLRRVQRELAHYRSWPQLYGVNGVGHMQFAWIGVSRDRGFRHALHCMTMLGRQGLLERVKQCGKCRRWFYARFAHQGYCRPACQQAGYKSSEEWREHRKEYMREYRRRHFSSTRSTQGRGRD